jgi:hypothetical protein
MKAADEKSKTYYRSVLTATLAALKMMARYEALVRG